MQVDVRSAQDSSPSSMAARALNRSGRGSACRARSKSENIARNRWVPVVAHSSCSKLGRMLRIPSNLANSLVETGDLVGAEQQYELALEAASPTIEFFCNYSRFLLNQGRWNDALKVVDEGLKGCPRNPYTAQLLADKALVYAEQNRGAQCLSAAEEALSLAPDEVRTNYLYGRALALVGRLRKARRQILKVLKMDPDNQDAQRALTLLDNAVGSGRRWWKFWK